MPNRETSKQRKDEENIIKILQYIAEEKPTKQQVKKRFLKNHST
jgi:hypothetical protein